MLSSTSWHLYLHNKKIIFLILGFNINQLKTYLKLSLTEVTFELIIVDSRLDLWKQIIDLWKKYLHFVIICNADNTNAILKVV